MYIYIYIYNFKVFSFYIIFSKMKVHTWPCKIELKVKY